ncbi:uncharacterized protein LOC110016526 [Oryzias latipes]
MGTSKLCFLQLLLLLLSAAEESRKWIHKVVRHQPDVIPVCRNDSSNVIMLTVCRIQTQGGSCRLTFRPGRSSDPECGSKFRMTVENQTVFLQLSSLGAEDSENSSCECVHAVGTFTVELNITVVTTGNRTIDSFLKPTDKENLYGWMWVLVLVLVSGILLGVFCRCLSLRRENICPELHLHRLPSRRRQRPASSPPQTLVEDVEAYDVFLQTENVLYEPCRAHSCSTISSVLT